MNDGLNFYRLRFRQDKAQVIRHLGFFLCASILQHGRWLLYPGLRWLGQTVVVRQGVRDLRGLADAIAVLGQIIGAPSFGETLHDVIDDCKP